MKVLLIQPPIQDFYDTDVRLQPIGLCYLKAAVRRHLPDIDIRVEDYHGSHGRRTVALPAALRYLRSFYAAADLSPFSAFHQYYHFGMPFEEIESELARLAPDVVGISCLFTPYYREALEVARRVKKRLPAVVVMGGSHVSAAPASLLSSPHVDFVVRGEGERAFVELLRHLQGQRTIDEVPNLGYRRGAEWVLNPVGDNFRIDDLPPPDLNDFGLARYKLGSKPMTFMITSRSCPHKCSFCSVHTTFGTSYRRRALEHVLEEIDLRYRQGYRVIDFEDDNLTYYKETFKELCRRLIERFPDREMEFVAMNGISYLSLDDELLALMRAAGFSQLNLALVSSDKSVRETTKRPHTLKSYVNVVRTATELGFKIVSYQILGLPNESLESMVQTLAFNARLPVLLGASPFYMTPQAPIARGRELGSDDFIRSRLTALGDETGLCNRRDVYTLLVTTRIINFLKGLPVHGAVPLSELVHGSSPNPRTMTGMELLLRLLDEKRLYFATRQGLFPNDNFDSALFFRVLGEARAIRCLNGAAIDVSNSLGCCVPSFEFSSRQPNISSR